MSPPHTELRAAWFGLTAAISLDGNYIGVIVEDDSWEAINIIKDILEGNASSSTEKSIALCLVRFNRVVINHVPRVSNFFADFMSNLSFEVVWSRGKPLPNGLHDLISADFDVF